MWAWISLWFFVFVGCAKKAPEAVTGYGSGYGSGGGGAAYDYAEEDVSAGVMAPQKSANMKKEMAPEWAPSAAATLTPPPPPPAPEPAPEQAPPGPVPEKRMVHYNGYARLRVTDPEKTLEVLTARAEEKGGYVEQRGADRITLRVPVDTFLTFYDDVLTLGDVLQKSLTAEDVTEAFQSTELRLQTAKATRARLQVLLARAKEEEEKLRLLAEIRRLTETIDALETQVALLSRLASLSRVTIEVVPRDAFSGAEERPEYDGFQWVANLSPFRRDVQQWGQKLVIPTPAGLVKLTGMDRFTAESPEGTVVWASRHPNDPLGDAGYWISAIETRLGPEFNEVSRSKIGDYEVLRMVEPVEEDPYVYMIAIRVEGRKRHLVEMYFPTVAEEKRYAEAIAVALQGGVS